MRRLDFFYSMARALAVAPDVQVACNGLLWQTLSPTSRLLDEAIAEGREVWLEVPAAARQPVRSTR
jgi:hypothetical protein